MSEDHIRHASASEGFDHTEPQSLTILWFAAGSVILLVLTIFAIEIYFNKVYDEAVYNKVLAPPSEQLKALHYREDWYLTHYMWVDKKSGSVRIPLDRAMDLFAQEASGGKLFYPAKSYVPKKDDQTAPAAGGAPVVAAAAPAK